MVGKDNQKPHIRIHRMSSSSMEKQQKLFYTEEPDCIQSHFSSQPAARRPSTSKTPYQLGIMDRAATGPEDAKPPTGEGGARRRSMMCVGKRGRLGMCLSAFPHQKPKWQTGGWEGVCHYQTQPRYPVEASMRMEIRRPRAGPAGRGAQGPAAPPRRPAFGCHWISKRIYNNQGGCSKELSHRPGSTKDGRER